MEAGGRGRDIILRLNMKTGDLPDYMFLHILVFPAKSFSRAVRWTMCVHKVSAESFHLVLGIFFQTYK